ncbi:MAG: efflux RND transporter periplasmic adaptor subunit [Limnobacter sp.]|nr:efflux RND transporter periplasmic adaptor subunit [Limnobacter sp.]
MQAEDLFKVQKSGISQGIELTGTFDAIKRVQIRSKASGVVLEMPSREGDSLAQGALIARIDPTEARIRVEERKALLASQKAQLAQALQQFAQNEKLYKQNYVSEAALINAQAAKDSATAQVQAAQSQLDLAQQQLKDTEVRAPFAGLIGPTQIQTGSKVSIDSPLLELLDIHTVEFKALASADQLQVLKEGLAVNLYAEGQTQAVEGKLVRISPSTSAGSRSIPVYIRAPNPRLQMRAGQFGTARVKTEQTEQGLIVPLAAIRESKGLPIVYVLDGEIGQTSDQRTIELTVREQPVVLGPEQNSGSDNSNTMVEIKSGLKEGQTIVGVNLGPLREGNSITISPSTRPVTTPIPAKP